MLRFYARYKQNRKNVQGAIGDPIRYDMQTGAQVAANTIIVQNTGLVSHPTGFPASPNWYEFTNDIIDGGEIAVKAGGSDKSGEAKRILFTDSEIEVSGEMVRFVAFHLVNNPNSKYNAIEVRIEDTSCGEIFTYPIFVITNDDLSFEVCDNDSICTLSFNITQDENYKSCLQSTLIDVSPNSKGNSYFGDGTVHPRFRVGYDKTSEALYILFSFLTGFTPIGVLLMNLIYDWIFRVGFFKLAPYVHTYINNFCEHCDLRLATNSFTVGNNTFSQQLLSEPSRGLGSIFGAANSPYRNITLMYDSTDNDIKTNSTITWQDGISPLVLAFDFLEEIKKPFNAKWEIYGNTLFLHRKDALINSTPVLDLVANDIHKSWLDDCVQITTIAEKKSPKYLEVRFGEDSETKGAEMKTSYQRIANFGFPNYSSSFGGSSQVSLEKFTMTQTTDDIREDILFTGYIERTILLLPSLASAAWYATSSDIRPAIGQPPYALIVLSEKAWNGWKLIAKDPNSTLGDSFVMNYNPQPYVPYNPLLAPYNRLGALLIDPTKVRPTYQKRNAIMHFDSEYTDNLFYYFWYIEDETRFPKRSEKANIKLKLCCEVLNKLGVNSPNKASIGFLVLIPMNGQTVKFVIDSIEIDYKRKVVTLECEVYRFNHSNI